MRFGLDEKIIRQIKDIFKKYPQIEKAIIYGSRAKGSYAGGSDIDLVLKGSGLNLTVVNKVCMELDDLMLPYTFDVSAYDQITNQDLIDHIQRVGRVFYSRV
mgnify:CR=1 FL=1